MKYSTHICLTLIASLMVSTFYASADADEKLPYKPFGIGLGMLTDQLQWPKTNPEYVDKVYHAPTPYKLTNRDPGGHFLARTPQNQLNYQKEQLPGILKVRNAKGQIDPTIDSLGREVRFEKGGTAVTVRSKYDDKERVYEMMAGVSLLKLGVVKNEDRMALIAEFFKKMESAYGPARMRSPSDHFSSRKAGRVLPVADLTKQIIQPGVRVTHCYYEKGDISISCSVTEDGINFIVIDNALLEQFARQIHADLTVLINMRQRQIDDESASARNKVKL